MHALVVKAKAVDRGFVLGQAIEARLGVALLRAGRGGAHLDKAETGAGQTAQRLGVFVETGGQTNGV